jgi:translation initiation factor IF-3
LGTLRGFPTLFSTPVQRSPRIPPPNDRNAPRQDERHSLRLNEQIRKTPIRLIGANGEQLGIVPTHQALEMARDAQLDLVEVGPKEHPPVCRIMDYGKFKYSQSKKTHSKTHQQKTKTIRLHPKTGDHDIDTKINQARKFLEHNDKVVIEVVFRGREMQHPEEGHRIVAAIVEKLADISKVEKTASMEGKRMTAILAPKPTTKG